jgi:hypothetical protein
MNVFMNLPRPRDKENIPRIHGVVMDGRGKPMLEGERYDSLIYKLTKVSLYENIPYKVVCEMESIISRVDDKYHRDIPYLKRLFKGLKEAGASLSCH